MPDMTSLTNAVLGMIMSYQIDKSAKPSENKNDSNNSSSSNNEK